MKTRVAIMGNECSGKTTFAAELAQEAAVTILDLETIIWETNRTERRAAPLVHAELRRFCEGNDSWIVEGCYGDLIAVALEWRPQLVFMNPGEAACLQNCRKRPWEPDDKRESLLARVSDYYRRRDSTSLHWHRHIYHDYAGPKREISSNAP